MDRHNITLFLQQDIKKVHPAGFEKPRRNIFDPEEDPEKSLGDGTKNPPPFLISTMHSNEDITDDNGEVDSKVKVSQVCSREGCKRKPRFDSIFCSDSCGISTLESDLLQSLQYAGKLHPSVLRGTAERIRTILGS